MKTICLCLTSVLAINTPVFAGDQKKPETPTVAPSTIPASFDFKGLQLGVTEDELKAKFQDFSCRDPEDDRRRRMADRICIADPSSSCRPNTWCENDPEKPWSYGGIRAKYVTALFYEGKMHAISVSIQPDQFQGLVEALIVKYGQPSVSESEVLKTKIGANYENQKITWDSINSTLSASKFTTSIDNGTIRYFLKSSLEEFARRKTQDRHKSAGQL